MSREEDCIWAFRALQQGDYPLLSPECVDGLLQWLCGRRHGMAESPRRILGDPAADKHLVERVYRALDATLFADDDLLLPIRGTRTERERRYRLLVRAFHPDRFPELGKWLIPRSQSVNAAYAAFRENPEADEIPERTVEATVYPPIHMPDRVINCRPSIGEWLVRITAPLSRSRNLSQTIMAVVAIVCTLLLMVIYYANRLV